MTNLCFNAAFQAGFRACKSRLQTATLDLVAFQASHAKHPEHKELSVCIIYYYSFDCNIIYCP